MHHTVTPPWLADDTQLELTFKKGKEPLSHRRWPGEPVPLVEEGRIQQLANDISSRYQPDLALSWGYENCTPEWQQAIALAISYVGKAKPAIPAPTMATLTRLTEDDTPELLDERPLAASADTGGYARVCSLQHRRQSKPAVRHH
ncbi:TPA: hypothetical protein MYO83_005880 [Klebsiella michiganensis]|nr:hypothetical protein [Klebsiella michiganensis]HCB1849368.1 hypothetical protein [Klebsiella oxytoca]